MEILRVYCSYYVAKQQYCVICLRSSEDRRMVGLKSLENFLKSINLPCNFIDEFQRVCYVCERRAVAAHRFRLAANVASSVQTLFLIMETPKRREGIMRQLSGHEPAKGLVRNVGEWETQLAAVRASTQLLQTEVLVVNSLADQNTPRVERSGSGDGGEGGSPAGGEPDVYVIPDSTPPTSGPMSGSGTIDVHEIRDRVHDVLSEPEIYMESVLILDEEEDPIHIKHEEPCPNEITTGESTLTQTNIHPNTQCTEMAIVPNETPVMRRAQVESTNFLLHPMVEKNGVMTVPSLAAQIVNGQLVTMDNTSIMIQTPKLVMQNGQNFDLLTNPTQVTNILKGMTTGNIKSYSVVSDFLPMNILESNVMQSASFIVNGSNMPNHNFVAQNYGPQLGNSFGRTPQISNVVGACNNKTMDKNSLSNSPSTKTVQTLKSVLSVEMLSDVCLPPPSVPHATAVPTPGNLVNALSGYSQSQVYSSKGVQHLNITHNDSIPIHNKNDKAKSKKETASGGKRSQSETENSKRSKTEGDGNQQKENPKQKETDWEDKIPMDVISFMDATDPNADAVLNRQPPKPPESILGVISNVHTVREEENIHSEENQYSGENEYSGENQYTGEHQPTQPTGESETNPILIQSIHFPEDTYVSRSGMLMKNSGTSMESRMAAVQNKRAEDNITRKVEERQGRSARSKRAMSSDKKQTNTCDISDVIDLC